MEKNYSQLALRARQWTMAGMVALLGMFTVNTLIVPSCGRQPNIVIWLMCCLPLLAFLPSLLKQHVRAHIWLCFVLLFYFMVAVLGAFQCASVATTLEVAAVVLLFISAMMYVRWRSRALKQSRTDNPELE